MKEPFRIKNHIDKTLTSLQVTPEMRNSLTRCIAQKTRPYSMRHVIPSIRHHKPVLVLTILLVLISVGALAWSFGPSIRTWFEQRLDNANVAPVDSFQETPSTPIASTQIGNISILVWEAMADEQTFLSNVEWIAKGNVKLVAYSGLKQDLPSPLDASVVYVSVSTWYGGASQEIFSISQGTENRVSILSEGWDYQATEEPMTFSCSIVYLENGQINTETNTVSAPVRKKQTLETAKLRAPLVFPITGYELTELHMLRTELRIYWGYTSSGKNQQLPYAIRNLQLRIVDSTGQVLPDKLPYHTMLPERLEAQIEDLDTGDIVESIPLIHQNNEYIAP